MILETADIVHGLGGHLCADGGMKTSGDICKAFGAGADLCMIGGMLAGTDECEGEWVYEDEWEKTENGIPRLTGKKLRKSLKCYGMSSEQAMVRYAGKVADYKASEGISKEVEYKGPAEKVIKQIEGGLRSCCTYVGASSLKNLSKCTTFVRVN
jgi:GMP reductase